MRAAEVRMEFAEMFHEGKGIKMKMTSMVVAAMLAMPAVFAAANEAAVAYYQVAEKDTLWRIAKRHGVDVEKICELNGRKMGEPGWDVISVGMRLRVPCAKVQVGMSAEEAVALYSSALSAELCEPSYEEKWVIFIDVDFDGVLEAVIGTIGGTAHCRTTEMYCIDKATRKVRKLVYDEGREEGDIFGYTWNDEISFLKDRRNGTRAYFLSGYVQDSSRQDFIANGTGLAVFTDGTVRVREVTMIHEERDENNQDKYLKRFMFMGKRVSEKEYREKERAFMAHYEKFPMRIGVCKLESKGYNVSIGGQKAFQRNGMTKQNLRACMLACYRAFSCGNLPELRRDTKGMAKQK